MITNKLQRRVFLGVKDTFPETFALRGYPGDTFRISESSSYFNGPAIGVSDDPRHLVLYTERWSLARREWTDFAKGTEEELRGQVR